MNRFVAAQLCLGLVLSLACTRYKPSYSPSGKSKGGTGNVIPNSGNRAVNPNGGAVGPVTDKATTFRLAADKFQNLEGLQAVVTYGAVSTGLSPMQVDSKIALLSVEGLPINQSDVVSVQVYQGENLRFIAKRPATSFQASVENNVVLDDCQILKAPWDGKNNDGSCGWTIDEK